MNTYKALKYLEEKFGIEAYNEICNVIYNQQERIKVLTKQRDNLKIKLRELKRVYKY